MLRLTFGVGYSSAVSVEDAANALAYSGVSANAAFDIGGALSENLILHARFSEFGMVEPTVTINGDEWGQIDDGSLESIMLAPALTYYFMPANVYLTLALGLSWLTEASERTDGSRSEVGFGANLDLGKEWWVSDNWGLGLAARFWFTSNVRDFGDLGDVTFNLFGLAAVFSATYN